MLKRKSSSKDKPVKASKKTLKASPLSKAEVDDSDEEEVGAPAAAAAAVAAAVEVSPKASTLKDGIELLNKHEAKAVSGRTRSLYADAAADPEVKLEAAPITGDPYPTMTVDGTSVLSIPQANKMHECFFETPVFPVGFLELDPVNAVKRNNSPDTPYKKANSADVVATVKIDGEELFANPDYESSRPGINLLYHLSADIFCKPTHASVFADQEFQDLRTKAFAGDKDARKEYISSGLKEANRSRGPPYLPCQASKEGAHGSLQDALKAANRQGYKITTKFFTYPGKDAVGSGPHLPSIELAKKLGGDDVGELVAVLENPENHGRQLKLVPIYDEHNKPVPVEKYRQTVAELRGGAITARIALRTGGKNLGPKDKTAHVAAYVNKILIVKRGEALEQAPSGGGIAAFLG